MTKIKIEIPKLTIDQKIEHLQYALIEISSDRGVFICHALFDSIFNKVPGRDLWLDLLVEDEKIEPAKYIYKAFPEFLSKKPPGADIYESWFPSSKFLADSITSKQMRVKLLKELIQELKNVNN